MVDLEAISGLPVELGDDGLLCFGPGVVVEEHKERLFDALTAVALDPEFCRGNQDVAYYMDNGIYLEGDVERLVDAPMRYEFTLLPPLRMGREYVKTYGHRHHPEPRSGTDYVEVCEVLLGTAHFVLQTLDPASRIATKAYYIEAGPGDKIVVPPNLDHCTINPGPGPMIFADVIALGVSGNYDRFAVAQGAAYFEIEDRGEPVFVPNPAYRQVPPLERLETRDYPELGLTKDKPLYAAFVEGRWQDWGFLNDPRLFEEAFPGLAPLVP